jgi:hypothetical protein
MRYVQGGFEFCEGTSAKWIFDVEIEKLRADIFDTCREDQTHARAFDIFAFPALTFHNSR